MQGPVLQPFAYDEAHPYASGQHRGVDIGAGSAGETVVAPAAGTVSFAGTVPTNGKSVTIETADGYSVTLTHLGSIGVVKGAAVAEQDAIGTVGPSGTPEVDGPYVHLGIRVTADPNGYVDPLGLLPPDPESSATESDSSVSQPSSSSAAPASKPAPAAPRKRRAATSRGSRPAARSHVSTHRQERAQEPRTKARTSRSSHRPAVRDRAGEQARLLSAACRRAGGAQADRSRRRPRASATRVPHAAPPQAVEPAARARVQRSGGCVRACLGARREPETATPERKLHHGCGGSPAAAAGVAHPRVSRAA